MNCPKCGHIMNDHLCENCGFNVKSSELNCLGKNSYSLTKSIVDYISDEDNKPIPSKDEWKRCNNCGYLNPPSVSKCNYCGLALDSDKERIKNIQNQNTCQYCGEELNYRTAFCPACRKYTDEYLAKKPNIGTESICIKCGCINPINKNYCENCGDELHSKKLDDNFLNTNLNKQTQRQELEQTLRQEKGTKERIGDILELIDVLIVVVLGALWTYAPFAISTCCIVLVIEIVSSYVLLIYSDDRSGVWWKLLLFMLSKAFYFGCGFGLFSLIKKLLV
ncbi:MAG: zinc ribbon domain-containing protein [Lachnospiraceae bacterium]|nr:zinc ribbon domain-containing protein [Lachnospiraceae bacterium]